MKWRMKEMKEREIGDGEERTCSGKDVCSGRG